MGYIFNVGDRVEVIDDVVGNGYFIGFKGMVIDVAVNDRNDTVYDVELDTDDRCIRMYFVAPELKEVM